MFIDKTAIYLRVAIVLVFFQISATFLIHDRYQLTLVGDILPALSVIMVLLVFQANYHRATGAVRLFWLLNSIGFCLFLLSELFWVFFDLILRKNDVSPLLGDALFFLTLIPMLAALALRPHSESAARGLRLRRLDFLLLTLWWICLYAYFVVPWSVVVNRDTQYNPANTVVVLAGNLAVIATLVALWWQSKSEWRRFYGIFLLGSCIFAAGGFLQNVALIRGVYYTGSSYDWFYGIALSIFLVAGRSGAWLTPLPDEVETKQGLRRLWAARIAILALISLPVLAIWGYLYGHVPEPILIFRLRLVFGAMLLLGSLVFVKLYLLESELIRSVNLTESSLESLRAVQTKISKSQRMAALGRLAAGAAHEISNPLTAILGYSELLRDNSTLTPEERQFAQEIQQQVRRAQAAVNSMRDLATPSPGKNLQFPKD
jgi:phospho-acceptor domain-containing protein